MLSSLNGMFFMEQVKVTRIGSISNSTKLFHFDLRPQKYKRISSHNSVQAYLVFRSKIESSLYRSMCFLSRWFLILYYFDEDVILLDICETFRPP